VERWGVLIEAHHFRDGMRSGEGSHFCVANVKIQLECYNHRYQGFHQCCHEMAAYQAMARMRNALVRLDADKDAVCMNGREKSNKPYTLKRGAVREHEVGSAISRLVITVRSLSRLQNLSNLSEKARWSKRNGSHLVASGWCQRPTDAIA
jgi:hypothetical protein